MNSLNLLNSILPQQTGCGSYYLSFMCWFMVQTFYFHDSY